VLNNRTVFVLQAAPEFSRAHADLPGDKYIPELAAVHEDLWKIPRGKRTAAFAHHWRSSLPVDDSAPQIPLPKGAFVCGDLPSAAPVEEVWLHGRRVAADVLAHLSSS
jgi:predicted NAD/FAD-dependent oxidoreductase